MHPDNPGENVSIILKDVNFENAEQQLLKKMHDGIHRIRALRLETHQLTFPRSVLISPLWPNMRMGCARSQLGNVLVENRECTIPMKLVNLSSPKSA